MIAFFPEPYEDELAYSLFARYHARSGHIAYRATADQLFQVACCKPSPEFVSALTDAAVEAIQRIMPMDRFVIQHTMFPYYARFLPVERRFRALNMLANGNTHYNGALRISRYKTEQREYLRYCPMCAADDRAKYGETYWHRSHQLNGINICPTHRCRLQNGIVGATAKKGNMALYHADEGIPKGKTMLSYIAPMEIEIANYTISIFNASIDVEKESMVGEFLQAKLLESSHNLSVDVFWNSYAQHYSKFLSNTLRDQKQLEATLNGQNSSTYDICLLAMFLDISASELLAAAQLTPTD